jgi:hypothetical protein
MDCRAAIAARNDGWGSNEKIKFLKKYINLLNLAKILLLI